MYIEINSTNCHQMILETLVSTAKKTISICGSCMLCSCMAKFADDTYLLVGSSNITTVGEEVEHISAWAMDNNLKLNPAKTKEMLVSRRGIKRPPKPPIVQGAERVDSIRVLGVMIRSDLRMSSHLDTVLASCSSTLYALRVLKAHGLSPTAMHEVARATTIAHLMYASPAWWGFANHKDRDRIDRFLSRMKRRGFLPRQDNTLPWFLPTTGYSPERGIAG